MRFEHSLSFFLFFKGGLIVAQSASILQILLKRINFFYLLSFCSIRNKDLLL